MDVIEFLILHRGDAAEVLLAIFAGAAALIASTRTPDPATPFGRFYRLVEFCALNFGRAKEVGPSSDPTYGQRIHDLTHTLNPSDGAGYAKVMTEIAEIAGKAVQGSGKALSILLAVLVVGLATLPLGACAGTAASFEAGIATTGAALDTASTAIDKAGDAVDNLKYRALKREIALACAKDIELLAKAADDNVWPIAAIMLSCPKVKSFVERGSGAVSVTVSK